MSPTFIGTQQQPWSLWCTNTSLTPCHQGCFLSYRVSKGTLTHRLTLESSQKVLSLPNQSQSPNLNSTLQHLPEQYGAALYIEGRQPIVCMPGVSCVP